jgi:hypothetical protein
VKDIFVQFLHKVVAPYNQAVTTNAGLGEDRQRHLRSVVPSQAFKVAHVRRAFGHRTTVGVNTIREFVQ